MILRQQCSQQVVHPAHIALPQVIEEALTDGIGAAHIRDGVTGENDTVIIL